MFNPGDIVLQKNTLVNGVNYKDNKENRLSIVLFQDKEDDKCFVYSCPITNRIQKINNFSKNHLYIPYAILNEKKLCSVKLNSIYSYPIEEVKSMGINIGETILFKIYNALCRVEGENLKLSREDFKYIKEQVNIIVKRYEFNAKVKLKEEKKLRKQKRKEYKQMKIRGES